MKHHQKLTGSSSLKDLVSTFVLTLLNFLRKLVLYFFMIYIDNPIKIKQIQDPLSRNTCSGHKNLSCPTPIVWNSLPTDLKLANSLNNFKHKLKDHFFKKLRNMEQNTFAYWRRIRNLSCNVSINFKLVILLFML